MTKILGSILAGLIVLQGAIPSLALSSPWENVAAVVTAVVVAGLSFYVRPTPSTPDTASVGK